MKVNEVSKRTGLKLSTIRIYEARGLVTPDTEERNGKLWRDYAEEDVRRLEVIANLRKALFSMEEIKVMLESPELIGPMLEHHRQKVEQMSEELAALAAALESIRETPPDAETLSDKLEETHVRAMPLPKADIHPRFRQLDEAYPQTAEERRHLVRLPPKGAFFTRGYFMLLALFLVIAVITAVSTIRSEDLLPVVWVRIAENRLLVRRFQCSNRYESSYDGETQISWVFAATPVRTAAAKLTRTESQNAVRWDLSIRGSEVPGYLRRVMRTNYADGRVEYQGENGPASAYERRLVNAFCSACEPTGAERILRGVGFGLAVLLLFHLCYAAARVMIGWRLYAAKPANNYMMQGMRELSSTTNDLMTLYGEQDYKDRDNDSGV